MLGLPGCVPGQTGFHDSFRNAPGHHFGRFWMDLGGFCMIFHEFGMHFGFHFRAIRTFPTSLEIAIYLFCSYLYVPHQPRRIFDRAKNFRDLQIANVFKNHEDQKSITYLLLAEHTPSHQNTLQQKGGRRCSRR